MKSLASERCLHCGLCTKNCKFLTKYHIDLQTFEKKKELSFHCFLCGTCTQVCPQSIDGKEIALSGRRDISKRDALRIKRKYKNLVLEKNPYLFKNYKKANYKSAIFMGCNFPAFFPKTTKTMEHLMLKNNIGIIYDCCGKPIEELGLEIDSQKLLQQLKNHIEQAGIEELVMVCPNCYYYLKGKLDIKIITIYDKIKALDLGEDISRRVNALELPVFIPCPDRAHNEMLTAIEHFVATSSPEPLSEIQCCGLGGCAFMKEPALSKQMTQGVLHENCEHLYTYCASCVSNFRRSGVKNMYHVLPLLLGVEENIKCGITSWAHRAKHKII